MPLPNTNLPNPRRIATARAALTTAMVVRADCPIISDDAVIELLVDLRHFCGTQHRMRRSMHSTLAASQNTANCRFVQIG